MTRLGGWAGLLFPDPPRELPGRRGIKIALRAVHVLCAGVLVGAHLLAAGPEAREQWLLATVVSGCLLLVLDLHESAAFLLQVRGLYVLAKVTALACLPLLGDAAAAVLAGLLVLSVILSHAPSRVRYFVVLGRGRIRGAESRG